MMNKWYYRFICYHKNARRTIRISLNYMTVAGMKVNYISSVPSFLPFVLIWKLVVL